MRTAQVVSRPRTRQAAASRPTTRLRAAREQNVAPRPRRKGARKTAHAPLPNGLSVMGVVVLILAVIGGMLVVSLNWQRNAHWLAQEEVSLRSALDHVADERQHLWIDERRASNPSRTAARATDAGLSEIKLDERTAAVRPPAKPTKPMAANAVATKQLPAVPKTVKSAVAATAPKPATATIAAKAPQSPAPKTERSTILTTSPTTNPTMPPGIAKGASVKAALAR